MSVLVNLRQLERDPLRLKGELTPAELELEGLDDMIRVEEPVHYDVTAEEMEKTVLVQGRIALKLKCECVRCLKVFEYPLELKDWTCLLALEGEDQAPVVNDCVDLTPFLREDILLEFPQHPLCQPECGGLPGKTTGRSEKTRGTGQASKVLPDWAELNKLKF
jgi:uncharacterized protein